MSASMANGMRIQRLPISRINPAPYNPRKDLQPGDAEYEKLKRSIERFGFVEPLVWNERSGNLVGGHQRLKILRSRGDTEVDVSVVDLDPQEEAALNVALNKIEGGWDIPKLADLLSSLDAEGFDATLTGFDLAELEGLLAPKSDGHGGPDLDLSSQYLCVVDCHDEQTLETLYSELHDRGFDCKLVL
jgi:ParB-like chromosome segregation protein Spo0J